MGMASGFVKGQMKRHKNIYIYIYFLVWQDILFQWNGALSWAYFSFLSKKKYIISGEIIF